MAANWTNTQVINQLVSGQRWFGATITYAFPSLASGLTSYGEAANFRAVNSSQQAIFTLAIQMWDDLIPQNFQRTSIAGSDIEFAFTTSNIDYAHAYFPASGSAWFLTGSDVSSASVGSYGYATIMHELGHALGLDHMGDYNGEGNWTPSSFQDSRVLSIMSYFGPGGGTRSNEVMWADWVSVNGSNYSPQTPMLNDVMAIQSTYGVSTTTRTGDTVYGFASNIAGISASIFDFTTNQNPILTIFDSAGVDTLNLSGWNSPSIINLESGVYSSANNMTNNIVIAYSSVIENAIGGGGDDVLNGNGVNNRLEGGSGNDILNGAAGNDTLIGGTGNDTMVGDTGDDTAFFSGAFLNYTMTYNAATGVFTLSSVGSGMDTIVSVEYFQFSDVTRTVSQLLTSDTLAPTLLSSTPSDNATQISIGSNLTLNFSESVMAGTGDIIIYNANGSIVQSISVADTSQVSFAGNKVNINPAVNLSSGVNYYVNIASGVFKDFAGNNFAGIGGTTALNFLTSAVADTIAPTLLTLAPADNATSVSVGANFVLSFSEPVKAGTGNIFIYNADGSVAKSIAVTDVSQVSFSGTTLVVNPTSDLNAGALYYVNVDAGVVRDLAGNSYAGISGNSAYNFTVAGTIAEDDFPWSTSTSGVVLVNGAASSGIINTVDDGDVFKVNLVAGKTYVFDLVRTSGGLIDPFLQLYSPAIELIKFDDDSGVAQNSQIHYTATSSGTYFLGAMDFSTGIGGYKISAAIATTSADDFSNNSSTSGILTIGGQVSGNIELATDEDWFKLTLQSGTTYAFELDGADSGGGTLGSGVSHHPYLSLYNTNSIYQSAAYNGGSEGDPTLLFTPATSGTYFLAASELYDTGTGSYTLKAKVVGTSGSLGYTTLDYLPDLNATEKLNAGALVFEDDPTPSQGWDYSASVYGDEDNALAHSVYRFTAIAGATYDIFSLSYFDPYLLRIFDQFGNAIVANDENDDSADIELSDGGLYSHDDLYAWVAPYSGTYYVNASWHQGVSFATYGIAIYEDRDTIVKFNDIIAPTVISFSPADEAIGVAVASNLTLTFSEAIERGNGDILLKNTAGTVIEIFHASSSAITVTGSVLTINPSRDLNYDSGYRLEFTSGSIGDLAGNPYLVSTTYNFTTAAAVAPLVLTGTIANDILNGGAGNDQLYGGAGNDTLYGNAGNDRFDWDSSSRVGDDTFYGGIGDDEFVFNSMLDKAIEYTDEGSDTLWVPFNFSLNFLPFIENLKSFSPVGVMLTGNAGNNILFGDAGNDVLNGGGGNDVLSGGSGIDTAVFNGNRSAYNLSKINGSNIVSGTNADGTDTLVDIERLQFSDKNIALDITGNSGQAYRLYQAAFDRKPDLAGLGYWIKDMDKGSSLTTVAAGFFQSQEFQILYGSSPDTTTLITNFYHNVLHRAPDQAGFDYWASELNSGKITPAGALASFCESTENQALVIGVIQNGIEYTPWLS